MFAINRLLIALALAVMLSPLFSLVLLAGESNPP
jgi:hypothetical protein